MTKFFDGAFGTYYYKLTADAMPCESANITNKDVVAAIHKEYISAGIDHIKTNTFNANFCEYNEHSTVNEIIRSGYAIAEATARNTGVTVFADIGNINSDDAKDISKQYEMIADIFIGLGAKRFLFETLNEYDSIISALRLIERKAAGSTVIVSFAVSQDGYTQKGLSCKTLLNKAAKDPVVSAVGLNCACGPTHLLSLVRSLKMLTKPLSVMPNSGYPSLVNGRTVFIDNKVYFAERLRELKDEGVAILGGCCGTTPAHMAMAVKLIRSQTIQSIESSLAPSAEPAPSSPRLPMKHISVELDPPKDCNCDFIMDSADRLKASGVKTITFADSPLARARADSVMTAAKVKREKNMDVLPHITCRDKNHIAIKGVLIAAAFEGINKILAVTGDPVIYDNYRKSGVFNFNSMELISYIKSLNSEIFAENPFKTGGALNVNAPNFDAELSRCIKKIERGADFLFSQPIFSRSAAANFIKARKELDCELHAGILPVAGYKNAVFLNNEVPGIEIPETVISSLKDKHPDEAGEISVAFSRGIIEEVYSSADGFYIMVPLKKTKLVCELITACFEPGGGL